MDEERREVERAKEEYQTPELVKHGTVEDLTRTATAPPGGDTFQGASVPGTAP
jgi:hypothetical protein